MAVNSESQRTFVIGYDDKSQSFEFTSKQLAGISRYEGQAITLVTEQNGKQCSKRYEVRLSLSFTDSAWYFTPVPENLREKLFEQLNVPPKPHREMIEQLTIQLNDSFKLWDILQYKPTDPALELKPLVADGNILSEKHIKIRDFIEKSHTVETPHRECMAQSQTPLQYCCEMGDRTAVELLVNGGADIEYCLRADISQQSPALHIAVRNNNPDLLEYLLSVKAKRDSVDDKGKNPLHIAAQYNANRVIQLLMFPTTDFDVRDEEGNTPLHLAIMAGHLKIAKILINQGADLNTKDALGQTPLHLAAKQSNQAAFKFLLDKGARWDLRDNRRRTPLQRVKKGDSSSFNQLVKSQFAIESKSTPEVISNAEDDNGFEVITIEQQKPNN